MNHIKSNNEILEGYRDNLESFLGIEDFNGAKIWNDMIYDLVFSLYQSAKSKYFKDEYFRELEAIAKRGRQIQEELIGGFE